GDGTRDLDPGRISFLGNSLGTYVGTAFLAVESSVRAGVLDVPGGGLIDLGRLQPLGARSAMGSVLAARVPSLINSPGLTSIGGLPLSPPFFNENLPLRGQPPVSNTVPGASELQEVIDRAEWFTMPGDPIAYVPHLRKAPLPGMPVKPVLVLFARGDQNVVNPQTSAYLRAGDLASRTTFYRHDLAFAEDRTVPKNPHNFLFPGSTTSPLAMTIALGTLEQVATFLGSDGRVVLHPEPARFFETPIRGPLPEDFGFIL
ncbi:MAG: hypothetical protein L0Z62_49775, partial [Gemmataceae bacterium]|nr:hypothetical protein [Gemmataceae bacterium]